VSAQAIAGVKVKHSTNKANRFNMESSWTGRTDLRASYYDAAGIASGWLRMHHVRVL
jgi:hypothetical protein